MNPNVPQYKEVVMQLVQMWVGDIEAHRSDQMELTPENEVKAEAWVRDDFRDNLEARQHEALNSIILYIKEKEVQASIDDIDDEFSDEEDDFGWIYVQEYENMEAHIGSYIAQMADSGRKSRFKTLHEAIEFISSMLTGSFPEEI